MIGLELTQENEWVTNHLFLMSPNLNVVDTVEVKELSKNISLVHMVRTRLAQYVLVTSAALGWELFSIYKSELHSIMSRNPSLIPVKAMILNVRVVPRAKKQQKNPAVILLAGKEQNKGDGAIGPCLWRLTLN